MNEPDADGPAFRHAPVMADEIVAAFAPVPEGFVLDATLGGGGHSERLLEAHGQLGILGIDRDESALLAARQRLDRFGDRVRTVHSRFDHLQAAMTSAHVSELSGALFDLGVSSPQLDRSERGFSYRSEAPLDMRMDTTEGRTAADVVNVYSQAELTRMLRDNGDERFAGRIAKAIVAQRPFRTTTELAEVIVTVIPAAARRTGGHPAKRSFQAIRIEVNRELEILPSALDDAIAATTPGGRIAVLSYHSGEDRIVKERFLFAETGDCVCPSALPCVCGAVRLVKRVRGVPRTPSKAELESNRRSASARLRVVERISDLEPRGGR